MCKLIIPIDITKETKQRFVSSTKYYNGYYSLKILQDFAHCMHCLHFYLLTYEINSSFNNDCSHLFCISSSSRTISPIHHRNSNFSNWKFSDHVRDRRQAGHLRTVNQAPAQIQQLLHAQQFRPPVVPVPAQPIPKLGPAQPSQPQQLSQAQVSQYRPQVQFASGVQQPDYRSIPLGGGQKPILPQQPQYRPLPQQNFNAAPQYSSKLPPHIQQLLQFQNNLSNSIPRRA